MIFLGFRFHFRITGRGTLHCYRCGGDRQYRKCVGRRWFHLFFVPAIPLDRVAEHVQCTICDTRYRIEVLALPTTEQMLTALPTGMRAAATGMVRAGDSASSAARASAVDAVRHAGLDSYDDAALAADLADASSHDLAGVLGTLARQLTMPAHEWFLADVVRVGLADGQLSPDERRAAREIAACLGMTPAQAHGVIAMTEESAAAG
jgi:tellurite resistance protein